MRFSVLLYCILIVLSSFIISCDENTNQQNTFAIGSNTNLTITGELDNTKISLTEGIDGFTNGWGESTCVVADTNGNYFCYIFSKISNDTVSATIYLIGLFSTDPSAADIDSLTATGTYGYGLGIDPPLSSVAEGAAVVYKDENGKEWSTTKGDQTGSTFSITENIANPYDQFTVYVTSGTFSCKLYDGAGNSITWNNGTFKARTITK